MVNHRGHGGHGQDVVAVLVAQADVGDAGIGDVQDGVAAGGDDTAGHVVGHEQVAGLVHPGTHLLEAVEGIGGGDSGLAVGGEHELHTCQVNGAVDIDDAVLHRVLGDGLHAGSGGRVRVGDDLDDAYHIEDVNLLVHVHIGSTEDEGLGIHAGGIVHRGDDIGHVDTAAGVGVAQRRGQRCGSHHIADVILLEVGRQHLIVIVVCLARRHLVIGELGCLNVENGLVEAHTVDGVIILAQLEAIDIEAHRVLKVVVLIVPGQLHRTQSCLCCKARGHRPGSLHQHIEAPILIRNVKVVVVLTTCDLDAVEAIGLQAAGDV